jgi:hypothetical protein
MELHIITTKTQTGCILFRAFGRVKLVLAARDVQDGCADAAWALVVPIAGQAATDADHTADRIGMRLGKAIVERDGLGEAEQYAAFGGNIRLAARLFEDVEHHLVMQADGVGRAAVGDPAVPYTVGLVPNKETVGSFDGGDHVMRACHLESEAEHIFGISAEAVERRHEDGPRVDLLGQMQQVTAA